MTPEQAQALREEFPEAAIGKLPRVTCRACSDNKAQKHCGEHQRTRCGECGNFITTAHIHLDYVGHAATTDRLLKVDPEWTWEPMALGPNGEPLMTNGGMWIRMTVAGVTKPGFGDGANPKEIIGDAIRNAAMRFGVALDLWAKEDLHAEDSAPSGASKPEPAPPGSGTHVASPQTAGAATDPAPAAPKKPTAAEKKALVDLEKKLYSNALALAVDITVLETSVNEHKAQPGFGDWLARQVARMDATLAEREQEAVAALETEFQVPAGVPDEIPF